MTAGFSQEASKLIQQFAERGNTLSATDYVGALNSIKCVERQLSLVFESFDLIMTPSAASRPWKAEQAFPGEIAGQRVGPRGHAVFTAFVNLAGSAGINLPCGESGSGLPIGLQLVSRPGGDGLLTGIAHNAKPLACGPVTIRWTLAQSAPAISGPGVADDRRYFTSGENSVRPIGALTPSVRNGSSFGCRSEFFIRPATASVIYSNSSNRNAVLLALQLGRPCFVDLFAGC